MPLRGGPALKQNWEPFKMKEAKNTEGAVSKVALQLAERIRQTGRRSPQELIPLIDEAEQLASGTSDPFTQAVCVRATGNAHQMLNNFSAALDRYDSAIVLFEGVGESGQIGRTLLAKVGLLFYLSRFDELFECARNARRLFEEAGDEASLARLDVNLGNAYHRLDRYHEAMTCYDRAFPILEETGDREGLLASSLNAGVVLTALHDFDRAEESYDTAMRLAAELDMHAIELQSRYNRTYLDYLKGNSGRALGDMFALKQDFRNRDDDRHVGLCWLDEAEMLLEIGHLSEAISSAQESREFAKKLGLNYELGKSLLFEAVASLRLGNRDDAADLLADASRRFESEGNSVWKAVSRLQTALFRGEAGHASALAEAASARRLLNDLALPDRIAMADVVIGRIQRSSGDNECAIDSFRSAVRLADESHSDWMQFHANHELGVSLSEVDEGGSVRYLRRADRCSTRCGTGSARTISRWRSSWTARTFTPIWWTKSPSTPFRRLSVFRNEPGHESWSNGSPVRKPSKRKGLRNWFRREKPSSSTLSPVTTSTSSSSTRGRWIVFIERESCTRSRKNGPTWNATWPVAP